ncbi:MAG: M3 family oligoendopeptidase [Sedimentisphaerales bacterium]|nr:M3 family oligoendopeptidase [Sedimentisphaerales bacterium]
MERKLALLAVVVTAVFFAGCCPTTKQGQLEQFIKTHVAKVEPLTKKANLAYWDATTAGEAEYYDRFGNLQLQISELYSNSQDFTFIKDMRESSRIKNPRLARQLNKLYYTYLRNQADPEPLKEIVDLDSKIQEKYSSFRGTIDDEEITMSDIYTILTTGKDCRKRELAWKASKQVGNVIVGDLLKLVKLRNKAAQEIGFDSYHALSIIAGEQSVRELDHIFDELYELTNEPFARLKQELDIILAESYGIAVEDLMPWHYHDPFFQRTPLVYEQDLDLYYKDGDVKELTERFYAGVGLPVDDILARSDLYDREGKYPHAFSHDVDRRGDVRILCNLQNTERWMETILHELGHAIYSKYHDRSEPWLLREPAHSFTTEAVAMFFGRLSRNPAWMREMLGLSEKQHLEIQQVSEKYLRFQQVLFVRWALVMYNFEKQLYDDPDQDLNNLWWELVEKYQFVKRPPGPVDAGWASKLHFTSAPCYYHNYMLGELLASQLHHHIVHKVLKLKLDRDVSYVGEKKLGDYLRKKVFGPGALYHWNEMIERATGEPLTPKYFVEQFVN